MKRFIITGMGHSGTNWVAKNLRDCGVKCTHEAVYRMELQTGEWGDQQGEASWPAAMTLDMKQDPEVAVVLHQTRNPLKVSRTFMNGEKAMPMFAFPRLEIPITEQDPQKRFGLFYARWNRIAERLKEKYPEYHRYQVESLVNSPANVKKLFSWLGIDPGDNSLEWGYSEQVKDYPLLRWERFSHVPEFLHLSADYGYL
jgi:hypothetical protein